MKVWSVAALALMCIGASGVIGAAPRPPRLPTEAFARPAPVTAPKLSPDGKRVLARITQGDEAPFLAIMSLEGQSTKGLAIPDKSEIVSYRWAGNGRVLVSLGMTVHWFGDDAFMTRLLSYDVATGEAKLLVRQDQGLEGDDVLYVSPDGDWLLLSIQRTVYDWPSVYRVDLLTGAMKQVVREQPYIWEWYVDSEGVVRAGVGHTDRAMHLVYRRSADEPFTRVRARHGNDEAIYDALRVVGGSDEGFVLSSKNTGRYALYRFNFATRETGELVFESPTNDVSDFDLSEDGRSVRAAYFTDDRARVAWFDSVLKKHQDDIDAALKTKQNRIVSRSRDLSRMIVWTGAADDPGSYYIYLTDAGVMRRLSRTNDRLSSVLLSPTRYVTYKARDGLDIPAYLTLPKGREPKGLPLVVLPHGGPYGVRDTLDYDPYVQFLANRGYAVLQPNFRGSEGYGEAFYKQGEGQWGRRMQDDLDDGMDWLVRQGTVDAGRVCLVGGSYGGYAALWGATRNPDRYRCAASFAGVSDLRRQLNYQTDFLVARRYRRDWRSTVRGAKDFDLASVSPLARVADLRVPVLLAHGDEDRRVPFKQTSLYAAALAKAGKAHEFYTYRGEGHGFETPANFKDWLDRLDAFLAKYNPAD